MLTISAQDNSKKLDDIQKILKNSDILNSDVDTLALFYLREGPYKASNDITYSPTKLDIYIGKGLIKKVRLFTDKEDIFEIKLYAPLNFYKEMAKESSLISIYHDTIEIKLVDVLAYLLSLDNHNYSVDDKIVSLTPKDSVTSITLNTGINSFLDYRIYTDFLSLFGKEGNGLIQTEVSIKIYYNIQPINRYFYVLNYFEPYFKYSKFDSDFSFQEVSDTVGEISINRVAFNQYAYVELGFMTNLLKIDFYQHSFELINVGFDYKYSDIKKVNAESPITLNSFAYYFGVNASLMKYKNFGMDIGFLGYFQRILNSEIEFSRDFDPYYVTDATLFYHPRKKKQNMIF